MAKGMGPIPGFPGYYASPNGRIYSLWTYEPKRGRRRKDPRELGSRFTEVIPRSAGSPYLRITLHRDGKGHSFEVHYLILLVFHGPRPDGKESCCRDGNKHNNRADNLYWGTRKENVADSIRIDVHRRATEAAAVTNRGKVRSPEVRAKIGAAHRGIIKSEEHCEALKKAHWSKGPNAEEILARIARTKLERGLVNP